MEFLFHRMLVYLYSNVIQLVDKKNLLALCWIKVNETEVCGSAWQSYIYFPVKLLL